MHNINGISPKIGLTLYTNKNKNSSVVRREDSSTLKPSGTMRIVTAGALTLGILALIKNSKGVKSLKSLFPTPKEKVVPTVTTKPATTKPVATKIKLKRASNDLVNKKLSTRLMKAAQNNYEQTGCYSPSNLDNIMRQYVGAENVSEEVFYDNPAKGLCIGRIISYKAPDGKVYKLESHLNRYGIVSRLFLSKKTPDGEALSKQDRAYFNPLKGFVTNAYNSAPTHLPSGTNKAYLWIKAGKKK